MSKEEDVKRVVEMAKNANPPLSKVIHAAGISKDVILSDLKMEDFHEVVDCKARSAWLLHELTKDIPLDEFVMISSIAPLIGGTMRACWS